MQNKYGIGDQVMVTVKGTVTAVGINIVSKELMYNVSISDQEYANVNEQKLSKLTVQQ